MPVAILSTPPADQNYIQMFGYSSAGLTTGKRTRMIRTTQTASATTDWDTLYAFDGEGYLTSTKYPDGSYYNVVLDALRRPSQLYYNTSTAIPMNNLPIIDQVTYNAANQMTQMLWFGNPGGQRDPNAFSYNATYQAWIYNTANQMVETYTFLAGSHTRSMDLVYQYPAGRDNGQISGMNDPVNSQQTNYTYDSLKRLSTATATTGSTTNWGQSYSYDQFGNLNGKTVTGGSGITFNASVDPQTNRLMGGSYCYDNNGNLLSDSGYACNGKNAYPPFTQYNYDGKNRLTEAQVSGGNERYYYTPDNKRVNIQKADGSQVVFVYGAQGEITALCSSSASYPNQLTCRQQYAHLMFGGRLVRQFGAPVALDRLGSVKSQPGGSLAAPGYFAYNGVVTYLPFGEDLNQVFQDETKFGTYWEDSSTGFSYADQRYYASKYGRFLSADPYKASAGPEDPGGWNRYAYVENDPVNYGDPQGLLRCLDCAQVPDDPPPGSGVGGPGYGGGKMLPRVGSGEQTGVPVGTGVTPGKRHPSQPGRPKRDPCDAKNPTNVKVIDFIKTETDAAATVSKATGLNTGFILAWAAYESGYGISNKATANNNYFGLTNGDWIDAVACARNASPGFVCFQDSGLIDSGLSALQSFGNRYLQAGLGAQSSGSNIAGIANAIAAVGFNSEYSLGGYGNRVNEAANAIAARQNCP